MEGLLSWVAMYGYVAIFGLLVLGIVGLPVPDETLLVFSGYLISRGELHPVTTFFTALAGSWCGISLSYTIGRTLGAGVIHRYGRFLHITEQRMARVHAWFDRIGHWALFVGYFIVGVRHFTALVAGISKLEFSSFVAYAWSGGFLWVATFLSLGYFLGENWREIIAVVDRYAVYASVVLIAAAAGIFLWRRRRVRTSSTN